MAINGDIIYGNVYPFVRRWLEIVLGNIHFRDLRAAKDWSLLQDLSAENFKIYSEHGSDDSDGGFDSSSGSGGGSNLLSFRVNRKTNPSMKPHQYVYRFVSDVVKLHCIDRMLTLPGFYAFLQDMLALEKNYKEAYEQDKRLAKAAKDLIVGYWNEVRPSVNGTQYEDTATMNQDASYLNAVAQLADEIAAQPENDLDPKLPFMKSLAQQAKQEISHVASQSLTHSTRPSPL